MSLNLLDRLLAAAGGVFIVLAVALLVGEPETPRWTIVGLFGVLALWVVSLRVRGRGQSQAGQADLARTHGRPVPLEGSNALPAVLGRSSRMPGDGSIVIEAEGAGGHLWLLEDRVRIKHFGLRGLVSKGFLKGDKEIALDQILLDDHRHVRGRVTKDAPLVNAGPPPTSLVARRPG